MHVGLSEDARPQEWLVNDQSNTRGWKSDYTVRVVQKEVDEAIDRFRNRIMVSAQDNSLTRDAR